MCRVAHAHAAALVLVVAGCASAQRPPPNEVRHAGLLPGERAPGIPDLKGKLDPSAPILAPAGTHTCAPADPADCEAQCAKENAASCRHLGALRADKTPYMAILAYAMACVRNDAVACIDGGHIAATMPPELKKDVEKWFHDQGCKLGHIGACKRRATMTDGRYFAGTGGPKLAAMCAGGNAEACAVCREVGRYEDAEGWWNELAPCWKEECGRTGDALSCSAALYEGHDGWGSLRDVLESLLARQATACKAGNASACEKEALLTKRREELLASEKQFSERRAAELAAAKENEDRLKAEKAAEKAAEARVQAERERASEAWHREQARKDERERAAHNRANTAREAANQEREREEAARRADARRAAEEANKPPPLPPGKSYAYKCQVQVCSGTGPYACQKTHVITTWCFE